MPLQKQLNVTLQLAMRIPDHAVTCGGQQAEGGVEGLQYLREAGYEPSNS